MSTISINVPVTELSDNNIAMCVADRLWTSDHVQGLCEQIFDECDNEGNLDQLSELVDALSSKLMNES